MLACRKLRNDATVFGVNLNLRRNNHSLNLAIFNNRRTGFIAGTFNRQQAHHRWCLKFVAQDFQRFVKLRVCSCLYTLTVFFR